MSNDAPDFTRAGCTRSFLGGRPLSTTTGLRITTVTTTGASGAGNLIQPFTRSIYVFRWGIATMKVGQAGFLTLRDSVTGTPVVIDSINLANETFSDRPQGIKLAKPSFTWATVSTPTTKLSVAFVNEFA